MDRLESLRRRIDALDGELAELFQARMAAAAEIADWKRRAGLPILDPDREQAVLDRGAARMTQKELRPYFRVLQQTQMDLSKAWQAACLAPACRQTYWVCTGGGSYPIYLEPGALARARELLDLDRRVFLVTDSGVPAAYVRALAAQCRQATVFSVPQGEASKCPSVLEALLSAMLKAGLTRADCVAALGGGVAGDLAGLAAALYMRGVDCYLLPTTLLAMADASVGGKTAVDLGGVKNVMGVFRQPKAVLMDPDTLCTLSPRQLANGMAEAVKMALAFRPELFARFERPEGFGSMEELISACVEIKRGVVERDEKESGLRRVLNLGHTLGHGIEAAAGGALLHGECVALGMLPVCAPAVRARLLPVLESLGLPTRAEFDPDLALAAIVHDKKSTAGGVRLVTVPEVGRFALHTASEAELKELLLRLQGRTGNGFAEMREHL